MGPTRAALRSLIDERALQASVTLAGPSAHAVDELAVADVVVFSSNWEGSPIVAVGALHERPLASTDVGDVAEVVESGVSGWLVAVGDEAAFGSRSSPQWWTRTTWNAWVRRDSFGPG